MTTVERTLNYPSHDGTSTIRALIWESDASGGQTGDTQPGGGQPDGTEGARLRSDDASDPRSGDAELGDTQPGGARPSPHAIFQIIHGAAEHVERYREFADFLVGEGFVVCANDHVGHGKSVTSPAQHGHMPVKGGREILIADVHALRLKMAACYPGLPYIMLGHSMGSFILRNYLAVHADGLAGAVISGTAQQPALLSAFGKTTARVIAALRGAEYRSGLLDSIGLGAFAKKIADARTPLDWLSTDPSVVDAYIADEACGMMFSAGAYATLTDLTREIVRESNAAAIPKDLPLLFIAGSEDPVGDRGKGVRAAYEQCQRAGAKNVSLRIYDGLRHEVLNEPQRQEVYRDIVNWLKD